MKTKLYSLLVAVLILSACSDSSEPIFEPTLTVDGLNETLNERPVANQSLGSINATSNLDEITYELVDQSIDDAFTIDEKTGEVFVKDESLFDINDVTTITGEVEVTSGESVELANINISLKVSQDLITYFQDVALGFELGSASEITRKWGSAMKIYVDGSTNATLLAKLNRSIDDINELATDGFSVELVSSESQSNTYFYFGTKEEYESLFPGTDIGTNWGQFNVWWNSNVINRARIFVDTQRPNTSQQESLILEELTQALGLGKDSPKYTNSIFYETSTNGGFNTEYSDLDRELVRLLYHPDMTVGLGSTQVEIKIKSIIKSEW